MLLPSDRILVNGKPLEVGPQIALQFSEGDKMVATSDGVIRIIPKSDALLVDEIMAQAAHAFHELQQVSDQNISEFFRLFAESLTKKTVIDQLNVANAQDVQQAKLRGRTTSRLRLTDKMRNDMIDALSIWQNSSIDHAPLDVSYHHGWEVETHIAPLGVVAFVFEGRPNVFADATGVLRGKNCCVFRIGSDAFETARVLMEVAIQPSLFAAELPQHSVMMLPAISHASAWALFSHSAVSLAVARGSGQSVALLGEIAQQHGVPVSLHGTGGAWMIVSSTDNAAGIKEIVMNSLDRKVCNTLNTVVVLRSTASATLPVIVEGVVASAAKLATVPIIHGDTDVLSWIQQLDTRSEITLKPIVHTDLHTEWEWEKQIEVSIAVVDSIEEAVELFNKQSPQFVLSVVSDIQNDHDYAWKRSNAPFVGNGMTRWVDGQYALNKPELGLANWQYGRTLGRGAILSGDSIFTIRYRMNQQDVTLGR